MPRRGLCFLWSDCSPHRPDVFLNPSAPEGTFWSSAQAAEASRASSVIRSEERAPPRNAVSEPAPLPTHTPKSLSRPPGLSPDEFRDPRSVPKPRPIAASATLAFASASVSFDPSALTKRSHFGGAIGNKKMTPARIFMGISLWKDCVFCCGQTGDNPKFCLIFRQLQKDSF